MSTFYQRLVVKDDSDTQRKMLAAYSLYWAALKEKDERQRQARLLTLRRRNGSTGVSS